MQDGGTKLPAALAIASEGALTLIGASLNRLVFPAILRSRRRPMQEASAYGKGFGCRPVMSGRPGSEGAGVRKPPKKEPAGSRWAVGRLWGFGSAAALPGDGSARHR